MVDLSTLTRDAIKRLTAGTSSCSACVGDQNQQSDHNRFVPHWNYLPGTAKDWHVPRGTITFPCTPLVAVRSMHIPIQAWTNGDLRKSSELCPVKPFTFGPDNFVSTRQTVHQINCVCECVFDIAPLLRNMLRKRRGCTACTAQRTCVCLKSSRETQVELSYLHKTCLQQRFSTILTNGGGWESSFIREYHEPGD